MGRPALAARPTWERSSRSMHPGSSKQSTTSRTATAKAASLLSRSRRRVICTVRPPTAGRTGRTIFRIDSSGTLATVHDFDPFGPRYEAVLVEASDGNLYGPTTSNTLFKMEPTGGFTTFHTFHGDDGSGPAYGLIQATDGSFYGATEGGGPLWGTLYKIDLNGTLATLHNFNFEDGRMPRAALIQATDGDLYGTTEYGGLQDAASGYGTIFRMDTSGNFVTLHRFNGFDGGWPMAPLLQISDGSLYGISTGGGPSEDWACIFRISSDAVAVNTTSPRSGSASGGDALQVLGGGFAGTLNRDGWGNRSTGCFRAGSDIPVYSSRRRSWQAL